MSKIILITGTSTGLGISVAVQAAQAGHTVYATMRNTAKRALLDAAAEQAGVSLNVLTLDVQDQSSIDTAVDQIIALHGRIDVLVNNAGQGFVRTIEQATEAEISRVMDINHMGVVRTIKAVIPHMRAARSGHIVNITSVGGLVGQPFNEIYCAAKFAVEGLTEAMASYLTPAFGIRFTAVEPGGISTEFAATVLKQIEDTGGMFDDEYLPVLQTYIGGAQSRMGAGAYQTPDEVAQVVMSVISTTQPPLRIRTSDWAEELTRFKTTTDPDGSKQQEMIVSRFLGDL
ncbi:SDR family oxidoreductase [Sagittula sp. SSi028]|uniref:SDR family oxidoreductase n=1 Tax=Sagittula sp. SSi028 TaxID=3400636 RepID=UPI003AF9E1F6